MSTPRDDYRIVVKRTDKRFYPELWCGYSGIGWLICRGAETGFSTRQEAEDFIQDRVNPIRVD